MTEPKKKAGGRPRKPTQPRKKGQRPTTRAGREKLATCGATNRNGLPCEKPAGFGTSHVGEGRCKFHGGIGQKPSQRYLDIQAGPRLSELVERNSHDAEPLDATGEVVLARSVLQLAVERHDETLEALLMWHASWRLGKEWEEALKKWGDECKLHALRGQPLPNPPSPLDFNPKPTKLPDLLEVVNAADKVASAAERVSKVKKGLGVSLATVDRLMERMGAEAVEALREVISSEAQRAAILDAIERRWGAITLDSVNAPADQGDETGG